ncbi:uncharacterized protein [Periplaneta americana]|uniref:uncharacterized protein isoform X3 n=1 Tax=Periplaneta americana TaxID=6978 RepID=UPI0037E98649
MDVIKMEPEVDPFGLPPHDTTYKTEENKALSEERNLLDLEAMDIKTEYVDHSYDITSEIKVEDSTMSISSPMVKCEVEEDSFDPDRVQQEQKVEVNSEKDEVLTERER